MAFFKDLATKERSLKLQGIINIRIDNINFVYPSVQMEENVHL